jgi:hypothetical protein
VLQPFGGKVATRNWEEGAWSAVRGFPSAVALFDGRVFHLGADDVWASVSDAYESFDLDYDEGGDSAALSRAIAVGGRNDGRWLLPLSSLMMGTDARVANARASSLDEILTPSNFGVKSAGRIGASVITPAELADDRAIFVERAGTDLYEITWSSEKGRYVVNPFSKLNTDLFTTGVEQLDVQVLPDQRIWIANDTDDAVVALIEPTQEVIAFIPMALSTGDYIESLCVVPGFGQDRLYISARRQVDGDEVRYIEKMALDRDAKPQDVCKVCDSFVEFGIGVSTVALPHLVGRTVYGWVDGAPLLDASVTDPMLDDSWSTVVPADGNVDLPATSTIGGILGLRYTARLKTARLAYGSGESSPMLTKKSIAGLGLLLADYVRTGVLIGTEFDNADHPLRHLPEMVGGKTPDAIVYGPAPDEDFNHLWGKVDFDSRICIEASSPKPVSLLSLVIAIEGYG